MNPSSKQRPLGRHPALTPHHGLPGNLCGGLKSPDTAWVSGDPLAFLNVPVTSLYSNIWVGTKAAALAFAEHLSVHVEALLKNTAPIDPAQAPNVAVCVWISPNTDMALISTLSLTADFYTINGVPHGVPETSPFLKSLRFLACDEDDNTPHSLVAGVSYGPLFGHPEDVLDAIEQTQILQLLLANTPNKMHQALRDAFSDATDDD